MQVYRESIYHLTSVDDLIKTVIKQRAISYSRWKSFSTLILNIAFSAARNKFNNLRKRKSK